jgi:hypothetical protein
MRGVRLGSTVQESWLLWLHTWRVIIIDWLEVVHVEDHCWIVVLVCERESRHVGHGWLLALRLSRYHIRINRSACRPSSPPMASSSSANFQSIFNASLQAYDNKTKNKLLDHPLATHLQSCDSSNAVLTVLQDLVQQFDQRRASDERLNGWLNPTVNVLCAFSDTLGEGVSLVSLNSLSLYDLCSDHHTSGIPPRESDIYGDWCPSLGEHPCRFHRTGEHDTGTS